MKKYSLIIFSSFLTGIAQQPIFLGFIAWFSFIPIFYFLDNKIKFRDFLISGFLWGFIYHLTSIYWLSMNIGTNIYLALFTMFLSVLILSFNSIIIFSILFIFKKYYSKKYLFFFPFIWVLIEYFRTYGIIGFPWVSIANTQTDYLILIQNAELFGIYGISLWILILNVILYKIIRNRLIIKKKISLVILSILIFLVPWLTGLALYLNTEINKNNNLSIGIVQPNIKLEEKKNGSFNKNFNKILNLSNNLKDEKIDLIIWPESALPAYLLKAESSFRKIQIMLGDSTKLITGTTLFDKKDKKRVVYNSIAYIDNKKIIDYYNKIQLVPMAEYVPWSNIFSFLVDLNIGQSNFSKGDEFNIFKYNNFNFGSVVCYESTFPWIFKEFSKNGAEFMIIVTNDGWYESGPEPQQHSRQSIFRAIETRKPIVRCANTGISMIIDQAGNINCKLKLNKEGVLKASIFPNKKITFYNKYGDFLIQFMGLLLLIFLIIPMYNKK